MYHYSVYLLRHCEYDSPLKIFPGRLPFPLSEEGKGKAKNLSNFFQNKNIKKIYSSSVLRCKQTAEIISSKKIPIVFDQRLLETLSSYQGYWYEEKPDWSHFFSHRSQLGGEGAMDILNRVSDFWQEILKGNKDNVIICSHGDPLFCLQQYIRGIRKLKDREITDLDEREYLFKGSIREIKVDSLKKTVEILPIKII